jgi:hypothetical protein
MYYTNINCSHISDIEKSLAVILPLFWIQDSTGTSEWKVFEKVLKALIIFPSNTNELHTFNVHLFIFWSN